MLEALKVLNPWIAEMFLPSDFDYEASALGAGPLPDTIKEEWFYQVNKLLEKATLPMLPTEKKQMQNLSGKNGVHSEELDFLLSEMQVLQRTYPGNNW